MALKCSIAGLEGSCFVPLGFQGVLLNESPGKSLIKNDLYFHKFHSLFLFFKALCFVLSWSVFVEM